MHSDYMLTRLARQRELELMREASNRRLGRTGGTTFRARLANGLVALALRLKPELSAASSSESGHERWV